jgi:hypothetical protein
LKILTIAVLTFLTLGTAARAEPRHSRNYVLRRQEAFPGLGTPSLRMNAAILGTVCRAIFATYSLQAFLNKEQGISPFHANLVQRLSPRRHHFNESLQFRLGSEGIDFGARSKSFGTRLRRSSPSGTFIGFLRTSFSNFLGKLVRLFSRATLACWSGAELIRTGIVSPRSNALSKIFENFEPQIPEKGWGDEAGTEGHITTAG